jgi:hypothetical protein
MTTPYESYQVTYECKFVSDSYNMGYIEIWLSSSGAIGIFIEKQQRIYLRLKSQKKSPVFGWSQEPSFYKMEVILKFLDLVSSGKFKISLDYIPYIGILDSKIFISDDEIKSMELSGETFSSKIKPMSKISNFLIWKKILDYKPWY